MGQRGGSQLCTSLGGTATLRTVLEFFAVRCGLVNGRVRDDAGECAGARFLGLAKPRFLVLVLLQMGLQTTA